MENIPAVSPGDTAEVMLAITENDLHSQVSRGENAGRTLRHIAVVRQLKVLGLSMPRRQAPSILNPS